MNRSLKSPVGVLPVIPGAAGPDPDDGRPEVDVEGQRGVLLPVLLRDPPTLHCHLERRFITEICE